MPKIIDHDAHKKDLARRAAAVFSKHGYAGIGMRGIAEHLNVSKSALYHYFPTKEALFLDSTEFVMSQIMEDVPENPLSEDDGLRHLVASMKKDFGAEMVLVFEYLRGKDPAHIASDEAMQSALSTYLQSVERIVGVEKAHETLVRIMGTLMIDYMSGGTWDLGDFQLESPQKP